MVMWYRLFKMSILQRLRNLWLLSNFSIKKNDMGGIDVLVNREDESFSFKETSKMAQIVKMNKPVDRFLEDNKPE